jgi:RNA-directed DNA polymerase
MLANLLLDDLDKELECRGHRFCGYADDCNIYVRAEKAGEWVMVSVRQFLEDKLRLRVNREGSAMAPIQEREFVGYRILRHGRVGIAPRSLERAKRRTRQITRRNRGISLEQVMRELKSYLMGWVTNFAMQRARATCDDWTSGFDASSGVYG